MLIQIETPIISLSEKLQTILTGLSAMGPEIILTVFFLLVIILDILTVKSKQQSIIPKITIIGMILAFVAAYLQLTHAAELSHSLSDNANATSFFFGMIKLDSYAVVFKMVFAFAGLLAAYFSMSYKSLEERSRGTGEFYAILIAIVLGMNLMAMSANLLMMYIALEMVSIGSYVLTAYARFDNKSAESGIKYILFGAVASGAMIFGISLLYGFTGTLDIYNPIFLERLGKIDDFSILIACLLTLSGFGYKIAMAPFHLWSPDVYEGAPTPVTAFMSVGPKAAGFAMLIRFLFVFIEETDGGLINWVHFHWVDSIAILAMVTMTIGNFAAIWQVNAKRMLAYSSIAHAGYLLMGVVAISSIGVTSVMFYMIIYTLMNLGAFMIIGLISESIGSEDVRDFRGLGVKMPFLGACLVIFLVSLTGLPPTAGFLGKMFLFSAVLDAYNLTGSNILFMLMIVGLLNSVVSLFYYFKIPLFMYLKKGNQNTDKIVSSPIQVAVVGVLAASVLWFFMSSEGLFNFVSGSVLKF